ncbi:mitochondrial PGP phosphatase-domain-containing protein [Irpex rosettiformis]|uniref:Mitochondrial PGP phosphatase-domain-containing protein n=1 Tax=Irpex rosettiformis TaxID=378272 RepID=A0ACB8U868_9APHY|nr:mitochondrial PGP phosphatase-domain-containing protein [Irpex rosettiformis]
MPFNLPGTLVPLHLIFSPRLVLPSLVVQDIRQLDFIQLRKAGYRGAVFDKDNCLTIPHKDQLVPELQEAWKECREAFGEGNVLIVSNSAGTKLDPGGIQAESVTYHLSVPVLRHKVFKPSYSCISAIRNYFASLPKPVKDNELIVVGDRIFTDVVLANRMSRRRALPPSNSVEEKKKSHESSSSLEDGNSQKTIAPRTGPLSVCTSGVWKREGMVMRYMEKSLMQGIQRYVVPDNGLGHTNASQFVRELPPPPSPEPESRMRRCFGKLWSLLSRSR